MSGRDPSPPVDLATRHPAFTWAKVGTVLHRFHARAHGPLHFDRSRNGRLNAPDTSYGVLYVAKHQRGAFAETFLREPGRTLLPRDLIVAKAYVSIEVTEKLRIVRLYGKGLAKVGCTAQVTHGVTSGPLPYNVPQAWSKALYAHPTLPDGIAYRSRHNDDQIVYAIFDRAGAKLIVRNREVDLDRNWFYELADHYRVGITAP